MDRLISEQAVMEIICSMFVDEKITIEIFKDMGFAIKAIPSANKLIPVSERLPQINEWVLCQCRTGYKVLKLTSYGCYCNDTQEYMDSFVIAWTPLPSPYQPQERSE